MNNSKNVHEYMLSDNGAPFSLVQYEAEINITQKIELYQKMKQFQNQPTLLHQTKPTTEDIVNTVFPPRQWKTTTHQYFMQYVSHQQAERKDIQHLQHNLEKCLLERQAKTEGICPIRQFLFSQTYDQIIRQVILNSPERGLLLMRVRDQRKMTIAAYQTLYKSSTSYGMTKHIEAQEGMSDLQNQLQSLVQFKNTLEKQKEKLLSKKESYSQKVRLKRTLEVEKQREQIHSSKVQHDFLEEFLNQNKPMDEPIEVKISEDEQKQI